MRNLAIDIIVGLVILVVIAVDAFDGVLYNAQGVLWTITKCVILSGCTYLIFSLKRVGEEIAQFIMFVIKSLFPTNTV